MSTRQRWAAVLVAASLLAGLGACADRSIPNDPSPSVEPSEEAPVQGQVDVTGQFTALSAGDPRVLLLTGRDGTLLPVHFADGLELPTSTATVVVAVPDDFDAGDGDTELFAALALLTESTGEPLEVVSVDGV